MPNLDLIQMSALYDTGNILHGTLDLDEILKHTVELGKRVMRARDCVVYVFEGSGLKRQSSNDLTSADLDSTLRPYLESVQAAPQLTHLTGLAIDSVWETFGISELVLAPLKAADTAIGALYVDRAVDAPLWSEGDVNLCEAFAEQVGLAVRNAAVIDTCRKYLTMMVQDIKQPTMIICDLTSVLLLDVDGHLNESQIENVSIISKSATKIVEYADDILDFARLPYNFLATKDISVIWRKP